MAPPLCHAQGCSDARDPRCLMCPKHWKLVPAALKVQVTASVLPANFGRDVKTFARVVREAIRVVASKENRAALLASQLAIPGLS